MKTIEKGTFGNSKAAHDLAMFLNKENDLKYNRTVSRILTNYFIGMIDIRNTNNITTELFRTWRDRYIDATINAELPIDIETRVRNLIVARYKGELKENKEKK